MPPNALRVEPVEKRADARAFLALPYRLYRDDPHWVPPLRWAERRRWIPANNPTLRDRQAIRFVAWRGRRAVGRIAAVLDPAFAAAWAPNTGFFGFFECEDDSDAAQALFDCAHAWLRDKGALAVTGPVNLSTHEEVGLLVDGFDSPPMLLSPYNPMRYQCSVLAAGYQKAADYYAYWWTPDAQPAPAVERLAKAAARRAGTGRGVQVRPADPLHWDAEVRTLFSLYNSSFAGLWGFVPTSWEEFSGRASEFRPFCRPELVLLAEVDGEAIGFSLLLPDINRALRRAGGRLLPFGWWRLMREIPRLRTGRFLLAGVLPGYVGMGVAPLLAHAMLQEVRRLEFTGVELSLVQEENMRMRHVIEAFGCPHCKTYRRYERAL